MRLYWKTTNFTVLFLFLMAVGFATNDDAAIVSKYQLNIGQYLRPANEKVQISDWLHPTIEDYQTLQNYLKFSERPELQYTNNQGTTWRENRIRNFNLIVENKTPRFEILYLNNDQKNKNNCIVTYVSFNDHYLKKLDELINQLKLIGFDGHMIFRVGGWPNTEEGCLELFDVPYAFKICAILEAKKLGYKNCLWLDSCFIPLKKLDVIFKHIAKHGVFFLANPNYSSIGHIEAFATEAFGLTLSKFLQLTAIQSFAVGLNLTNARGLNLLHAWHEMAKKQRLGFLSFIPEMAPLYILIDKLKLLPYAANPSYFSCHKEAITSDTILFWNHE